MDLTMKINIRVFKLPVRLLGSSTLICSIYLALDCQLGPV